MEQHVIVLISKYKNSILKHNRGMVEANFPENEAARKL